MTRAIELAVWLMLLGSAPVMAQSRPQTPPPPPPGVEPQPVGRAGERAPAPTPPQPAAPAPRTPQSQAPASQTPPSQQTSPRQAAIPAGGTSATARDVPPASVLPVEPTPSEAQLGVPVYPGAKFLRSYDAGQGQRYYLFGANASFAELVLYYRTQLKTRGDLVYDQPPVHMFEVGRFREETMAFPPGVTIKDYTWGGGKGYLVPIPGANPSRYPTIIQIVPVVPGSR